MATSSNTKASAHLQTQLQCSYKMIIDPPTSEKRHTKRTTPQARGPSLMLRKSCRKQKSLFLLGLIRIGPTTKQPLANPVDFRLILRLKYPIQSNLELGEFLFCASFGWNKHKKDGLPMTRLSLEFGGILEKKSNLKGASETRANWQKRRFH
jgi:hypothetical protein